MLSVSLVSVVRAQEKSKNRMTFVHLPTEIGAFEAVSALSVSCRCPVDRDACLCAGHRRPRLRNVNSLAHCPRRFFNRIVASRVGC